MNLSDVLTQTADVIGIIGVLLILVAYFMLQTNRLSAEGKTYSILNLIGAALVLHSLFFNWNTPAALMEGLWVIISFWGMLKSFQRKA